MNTTVFGVLAALVSAPRVVLVTALIALPVTIISLLLLLVVPVALFADTTRGRRAERTLQSLVTALATLARFVAGKHR
ncbi:hypothetical protein ACFVH4_09475 [Nocardia ignorata]|uniref:hypothetical protein n=1 Tax=Nocardia ignorata TaxID=145285 RepID=UPI00362ED3B7